MSYSKRLKYHEMYDKLFADNHDMRRELLSLKSLLTISEQKLLLTQLAFDLCQKLCQHLKTENQLLRSQAQDLATDPADNPFTIALTMDSLIDGSPQTAVEPLKSTPAVDGLLVATEPMASEALPTPDVCNSDLIAIQYEKDIKELREECSLLDQMAIEEVVITREDVLNADSHLYVSEEEESDCPEAMDVDSTVSVAKNDLKCRDCGKRFSDETTLDGHRSQHRTAEGEVGIRCAEDSCGLRFDDKHRLIDHLKAVHRCKRPDPKTDFRCRECSKELSSMQSLRQHQRSVHNMVSSFRCKFSGCDEKFDKQAALRAHEEVHRRQKTKIGVFKTKSTISSVNDSEGTCDKAKTPTGAKGTATTPTAPAQFKCTYGACTSVFKHKTSLKKHEQKCHSLDERAVNGVPVAPAATGAADDMALKLKLLQDFYAMQQIQTDL